MKSSRCLNTKLCANIEYIDGFIDIQENLRFKLFTEIEDEIKLLRSVIDLLGNANEVLKNKLTVLERSTIDLNWDSNTPLLKGTALQPPLSRILQEGLTFWLYFSKTTKSLKENFKKIDVRNEKAMKDFEKSFELDLENECVSRLLSLTQYVINPKAVI
ncbi:hypothetical protein JTB14_036870 [Gonioctena quinquepunctata]|nr:hypothetical protein JTB14_036870 [Gonioctena quinquepunctata]